jgi:hypothetical protein
MDGEAFGDLVSLDQSMSDGDKASSSLALVDIVLE